MKSCYIVAAAELAPERLRPEPGDMLIAADAGLLHLERLGLAPDLALGDFDSLGYVPEAPQVEVCPCLLYTSTEALASAIRLSFEAEKCALNAAARPSGVRSTSVSYTHLAKGFILGKIYNARWVLERATRDHPMRVPVEDIKRLSSQLATSLASVETCETYGELLGLEGEAAQKYFAGFDSLILQQRETFAFTGRSRRPPLDPVNAMLGFAYSLLARECASALEGVGLDPYVGFLHRPRPGRSSLALDIMEELRCVCACLLYTSPRALCAGRWHIMNLPPSQMRAATTSVIRFASIR